MEETQRVAPRLRWIFVTGAPRSGTTFVAEILRSAPRAVYVHEPFNPSCAAGGLRLRYLYLAPGQVADPAPAYRETLERLLELAPIGFRTREWSSDPMPLRLAKRVVGGRGAFNYRLARLHPRPEIGILKDPTAFFLLPFIRSVAEVQPLVVVRHPAAWAASFLRTGWSPELELFRRQPTLLERLPTDTVQLLDSPLDRVEQIALFWRIVYGFLFDHVEPGSVLRHERLSAQPLEGFAAEFERLDIPWSSRVRRRIQRLTAHASADPQTGRLSDLQRDSASIFETRMEQLSAAERDTVWGITEPVASRFYDRAAVSADEIHV